MMLMRFRFLGALAAFSLALGLSACSGGSGSPSAPQSLTPQALPQSAGTDATTMSVPADGPRTWSIQAGASTLDQAFQDLDFYTGSITINAGDSVKWRVAATEPHTVSFLLPGQPFPPDGSAEQVTPAGGHVVDGTKFVSSGLLTNGQTFTASFPKPGTYRYFCLLHHPEMTGVITVQKAGTPYPKSQADYLNAGYADEWHDLNLAYTALAQFPFPSFGTTIAAGITPGLISPPPSQTTVLRFLQDGRQFNNNTITIKLNTTLTWKNESNNEPHTVTLPVAGQPLPNVPPFIPPAGGPTYDGTTFTNSGVMPPGKSYSLKFIKRGTFAYFCLFHFPSGMKGWVKVI
jgi:plastocyanin